MSTTLTRYPGAQSFGDNDFSRRTFFGREKESVSLTDEILANRLVVVYAKSGLGKTSLLNAGVAPRLREVGNLPLLVRVNDIQHGPMVSVLEGIRTEAERQQVEYVEGDTSSLWSFFNTVEFWQGDLLLKPVLIVDQFEELFTLQSEPVRDAFVSELGSVIRDVPPPSLDPVKRGERSRPTPIRVVLCLREDFLGLLDEIADRIPQILDHRFRLSPLTLKSASEAMTGPAMIDDPAVATRPFVLDSQVVQTVLNHLSVSTVARTRAKTSYVEPFHLQLICQHIEQVVAVKQRTTTGLVTVRMEDIGGEAEMTRTLVDFYMNAVRAVNDRHQRSAVRHLCEEILISPEGRRLSLDEREIGRLLKLPDNVLKQLVETRLLRADQRADNVYYELSHDALVEPILSSRRRLAFFKGGAVLLAGTVLFLAEVAFGFLILYNLYRHIKRGRVAEALIFSSILLALDAAIFFPVVTLFRNGIRTRRRYRHHRPQQMTEGSAQK